ncbi:hypothetical protein [Stieleria magnilauensis]|uniref:BON domain protein n=1 Tax=Stieleria magnilauensis TaxID=2527963 RepID=A0ABX5XZT5_9BACT|nr:hypothetical protein [Phycisphaera sp. RhM]QDV87554.1 hypothetical protein TBK1r_65850 [Planctomycetes bacterium TBK1r]
MATTQFSDSRITNLIQRIDSVLCAHHELCNHLADLKISMEGSRIVLRGHLPSVALKQALVPAIRQAGVLGQVCNCVEIA